MRTRNYFERSRQMAPVTISQRACTSAFAGYEVIGRQRRMVGRWNWFGQSSRPETSEICFLAAAYRVPVTPSQIRTSQFTTLGWRCTAAELLSKDFPLVSRGDLRDSLSIVRQEGQMASL